MFDYRIESVLSKAFGRPPMSHNEWKMMRSAFVRNVQNRQAPMETQPMNQQMPTDTSMAQPMNQPMMAQPLSNQLKSPSFYDFPPSSQNPPLTGL